MTDKMRFPSLAVIAFALSLGSCNTKEPTILRFSNPLQAERQNEVVSLTYKDLTNETGDFPDGMLPLFSEGHDTLVSQNIDLNNDGKPEEILVEIIQ